MNVWFEDEGVDDFVVLYQHWGVVGWRVGWGWVYEGLGGYRKWG